MRKRTPEDPVTVVRFFFCFFVVLYATGEYSSTVCVLTTTIPWRYFQPPRGATQASVATSVATSSSYSTTVATVATTS